MPTLVLLLFRNLLADCQVSRRSELQSSEFSTPVEYQNISRFLDSDVLVFHSIAYRAAATLPKIMSIIYLASRSPCLPLRHGQFPVDTRVPCHLTSKDIALLRKTFCRTAVLWLSLRLPFQHTWWTPVAVWRSSAAKSTNQCACRNSLLKLWKAGPWLPANSTLQPQPMPKEVPRRRAPNWDLALQVRGGIVPKWAE